MFAYVDTILEKKIDNAAKYKTKDATACLRRIL